VEDGIELHPAVIAEIFAVRPFVLDIAARIEIALDDEFGVGRHADIVGDAFDHRQRRVAQLCDQLQLVARHAHRRRDMIDRMRADDEAHRQSLAARLRRDVDRAQIARRVEIDAGLALAAQHQAPQPRIDEAGLRIDREIDRGRDIGAAILPMLQMDGQGGDIDLIAGQHHLLHRRSLRWNLDDLALARDAAHQLVDQLLGRHAEGAREPAAIGIDIAGELGGFGAGLLEPHRLGIAAQPRGDIGKLDLLLDDLGLARGGQLLEKAAQAKALEIEIGDALRRIAGVHGSLPVRRAGL